MEITTFQVYKSERFGANVRKRKKRSMIVQMRLKLGNFLETAYGLLVLSLFIGMVHFSSFLLVLTGKRILHFSVL